MIKFTESDITRMAKAKPVLMMDWTHKNNIIDKIGFDNYMKLEKLIQQKRIQLFKIK